MGGIVDGPQPFRRHFGIDLGGRDRGVAKQFLDHPDVRTMVKHVRGAAVAQHVGCQLSVQTGAPAVLPDDAPGALTTETPSPQVEKKGSPIGPPGPLRFARAALPPGLNQASSAWRA